MPSPLTVLRRRAPKFALLVAQAAHRVPVRWSLYRPLLRAARASLPEGHKELVPHHVDYWRRRFRRSAFIQRLELLQTELRDFYTASSLASHLSSRARR